MNCPVDSTQLIMSERQGIEIDYCPKCRGVWLDRGELDKVIERTNDDVQPERSQSRESHGGQPKKKKKNLLGELFELGG